MIERIARSLIARCNKLELRCRLYFQKLRCGRRLCCGNNFQLGTHSVIDMDPATSSIQIGDNVQVRRFCSLYAAPSARIEIGSGVFLNNHCTIFCRDHVIIGDHTLLGEGVRIYDHNHRFRVPNVPIGYQGYLARPIRIGSNCWLGSNTVILPGVTIGDHSVVAASCLIDTDIPPNTLVKPSTGLGFVSLDPPIIQKADDSVRVKGVTSA